MICGPELSTGSMVPTRWAAMVAGKGFESGSDVEWGGRADVVDAGAEASGAVRNQLQVT
jgi:hypothetical protein